MTKGREAPRGASRPFARAGLSAVPVKVAGLRLLPGSGLVITALPEQRLAEDLGRLLRRHAGRLRLGWSRSWLRGSGLRCRLRFGLRARRGGAADLRRGELDRAVGAHAGIGTQVGELVVAALDHAYVAALGVDVEPVPAHRPHERDGRGLAVETDVYRRQTQLLVGLGDLVGHAADVEKVDAALQEGQGGRLGLEVRWRRHPRPVSYTHLTLPTI